MSIEVEHSRRGQAPRRLAPALLAAGAVVAVGIITLGGGTSPTSPSTTLAEFGRQALSSQVPGLEGTLYAVTTVSGDPTLVIWESSATEPQILDLDTRSMRLNADLTQLAGIDFTSRDAGDARVGPPGGIRAVTPNATGVVWHDTDPLRLAMSRTLDDTSLWFADVMVGTGFTIASGSNLAPGTQVVAYGDWGVAAHSAPDSDGHLTTIVLNADGAEVLRLAGEVVGSRSGPAGGVMVADRRTGDVSITWEEGPNADGLLGVGDLLSVVWSEDLTSQAELRDGAQPGIDLLHIQVGDSPVITLENLRPMAWDPSGRFLAAAQGRQIVVVDASDGTIRPVEIPRGLVTDLRFGP